MKGFEVGSSV